MIAHHVAQWDEVTVFLVAVWSLWIGGVGFGWLLRGRWKGWRRRKQAVEQPLGELFVSLADQIPEDDRRRGEVRCPQAGSAYQCARSLPLLRRQRVLGNFMRRAIVQRARRRSKREEL